MNEILKQIFDLSISLEKEDFLTSLFGSHTRNIIERRSYVILFGAGEIGRDFCEVLQLHGVQPIAFCDNSISMIGSKIHGIPIISPVELKPSEQDCLIVVSTHKYADEVREQLLNLGFISENILSLSPVRSLNLLRYYHWCDYYTENPIHSLSMDDLQKDKQEITKAYHLLSDQRSKDLFTARLALFITKMDYLRFSQYLLDFSKFSEKERDDFPFYVSPEDYGYFNNDLILLQDGEVLVDGGAYNGLSAATFAETCKRKNLKYDKIYCFEPDSKNFDLLRNNTSNIPNTVCIRRGLWSKTAVLSFISDGKCDATAHLEISTAYRSNANANKVEVYTISVDEQFMDEDISFIKMDIEGAEVEAICGSANTIKRCRPKLAISAYHKHSDIYRLPLLIHEIYPGYKFYLRQYGYTLFDMVLFAVPLERKLIP